MGQTPITLDLTCPKMQLNSIFGFVTEVAHIFQNQLPVSVKHFVYCAWFLNQGRGNPNDITTMTSSYLINLDKPSDTQETLNIQVHFVSQAAKYSLNLVHWLCEWPFKAWSKIILTIKRNGGAATTWKWEI